MYLISQKHLSDVLAQLNQIISNDPNGIKPEDSSQVTILHKFNCLGYVK